MSDELKTIKDNDIEIVKLFREKLFIRTALAYRILKIIRELDKAEAVKWVKSFKKDKFPRTPRYAFRAFFNLTEEDLK